MSVSYNADHLRVRWGVVNPLRFQKFTITVNARDMDVFNISEDDIKYLDGIMVSQNDTKTKGKKSKHSKYTTFDTNINIESILEKMKTKLYIKPYRMNLYKEGASHPGDESPEASMGTIVLILPTTYTGGEFVFSTLNVEESLPKDKVRFIYFETGLEHTVNKVLSGNRITLVYNVFYAKSGSNVVYPDIELMSAPKQLYDTLLREAIEFCKDKQNVLLGDCKYGNNMFLELKNDLKKHYKIINVCLKEGAGDIDITQVTQVYEVNEEEDAEEWYGQKGDEFDDYIIKTHKVDDILFPDSSEVGNKDIMYKMAHGEDEGYAIEIFRCSLINPNIQAAVWADSRLAKRAREY